MLAPGTAPAGGLFASDFAESDLRRLCGQARFEEADRLQRAKHVLDPRIAEGALVARVRGTWRREFAVSVGGRGTELLPTCTCGAGGFCRHAGAALLHALRAPDEFAGDEQRDDRAPFIASPLDGAVAEPQIELEQWLGQQPMNELRAIAGRWGLRIRARTKAEYMPELAAAMVDPAAIDRMLASLSESEQIALSVAYVLNALGAADPDQLLELVARFGGEPRQVDLDRLAACNLLMLGWVVTAGRDRRGYVAPRAFVRQAPVLGLPAAQPAAGERSPATERAQGAILIWILALVQAIQGSESVSSQEVRRGGASTMSVRGWVLSPVQGRQPGEAALAEVNVPRMSFGIHLDPIMAHTGASPLELEFTQRLLLDLGILRVDKRSGLDDRRLRRLLSLPEPERRALLATAWAAMSSWVDLAPLMYPPLSLRISGMVPAIGQVWPYVAQRLAQARYLLSRVVGIVAPEQWYQLQDLLMLVRDLLRVTGTTEPIQWASGYGRVKGQPVWWFSESDGKPQDLAKRHHWEHVLLIHIEAQLRGPLRWLGLIEITAADDGSEVVRLDPAAGALANRAVPREAVQAPPLIFESDQTVIVPPAAGSDIYNLLGRAAELAGLAPAGPRYRLTPDGVQHLFDDGMTAADLLATLERHAAEPPPSAMRATIERWWRDYGAVRLYDDVTLVELADDFLLPQLLAATALREYLIDEITPRLLAVAAGDVDVLVAELTRLGMQPRVLEEG